MKYSTYEGGQHSHTVIAPANGGMTSHFQSSVIKTAPGRMHQEFSTKQEPLDMAALSTIQDLNKMPPIDHQYWPSSGMAIKGGAYYYGDYAGGVYQTGAVASTSSLAAGGLNASAVPSNPLLNQLGNNGNVWRDMANHYSYVEQQQQQRINVGLGLNNYMQQHQQVPTAVEAMLYNHLSPVDSGIEIDSMDRPNKSDFFVPPSVISVVQSAHHQQQQHEASVITHAHQDPEIMQHVAAVIERRNTDGSVREVSIPIVIPKHENPFGFQYALETPISTSIRREDDRMTYVNKGQFYTLSFEYIPDHAKVLKGMTVRTQIMVVFREDKPYDEEIRTWQVWHRRQHNLKQRILEVDAKNSSGILGQLDEVALNAVQFLWNPSEQTFPKVSVAIQCLSTDFSSQKGVKGLPLHLQIDTYDDQVNQKIPFHRGYCQIKVFCDKGAERKLRDEDKRANRRKNVSGSSGISCRKKAEGEYHEMCDRSHFYHMSDLDKPAPLYVPPEDLEARFLDSASIGSYEALSELEPQPKRPRPTERIMIYVRKDNEDIYTPLHLVPPTVSGLARAISEKYNLDESKMFEATFLKQCAKGATVKIDDDMLKHYSNQDTFIIDIKSDRHTFYSVTLVELTVNSMMNGHVTPTNGMGNGMSSNSRRPYCDQMVFGN